MSDAAATGRYEADVLAAMDAIAAAIQRAGIDAYLGEVAAPTPAYPYAVVWGQLAIPQGLALSGNRVDVRSIVRVTVADTTTRNVLLTMTRTRAQIEGLKIEIEGRYVHPLMLVETQPVTVDQQVTVPHTDRHPLYGVDGYALVTTPARECPTREDA